MKALTYIYQSKTQKSFPMNFSARVLCEQDHTVKDREIWNGTNGWIKIITYKSCKIQSMLLYFLHGFEINVSHSVLQRRMSYPFTHYLNWNQYLLYGLLKSSSLHTRWFIFSWVIGLSMLLFTDFLFNGMASSGLFLRNDTRKRDIFASCFGRRYCRCSKCIIFQGHSVFTFEAE